MARPNSYKTRRQLVHCRTDVVTTRRNVVVNPSYLVQNSQTTCELSYRCRDYSKKDRSNPVISRHYTVLCRNMSHGTRHNSLCRHGRQTAQTTRQPPTIGEICTRTVRQSTDELRDQYEKSSAHFGRRVVARFLNRLKIS